MKTYEYEVYIANVFKYIHLLSKKEQNIKTNAILKNYRGISRRNERNHTYIELIKKIVWLANQVPL